MPFNKLSTKEKTTSVQRREFLRNAGLSALGLYLLPSDLFGKNALDKAAANAKLSMQLYTVRDELSKDIPGTLKKLKDIGFNFVETAFWPKAVTIKHAAKYLKDAGLEVSSVHIEIPVGDKKQIMLETAEAFNCKKMIWHGWPEDKRYSSLDGTKELANIYNEANAFAKANGLQFGLHNHWWEFRNKVDDKYVYEVLLENLDTDIFFELDTYWIKVAGHDPAAIITKFGKRVKLLHIKDGPAQWHPSLADDNPDPMTPVGKGTQNIPAIVAAAKDNVEWMVIEMDKVSIDVFEALKESYKYLTDNKMVKTK